MAVSGACGSSAPQPLLETAAVDCYVRDGSPGENRMAIVYAAFSKVLAEWGAEVGLTKHIYKLGVADTPAAAAVEALNAGQHAGAGDWKLLAKREWDGADEAALIERLARKEKLVDPALLSADSGLSGHFQGEAGQCRKPPAGEDRPRRQGHRGRESEARRYRCVSDSKCDGRSGSNGKRINENARHRVSGAARFALINLTSRILFSLALSRAVRCQSAANDRCSATPRRR